MKKITLDYINCLVPNEYINQKLATLHTIMKTIASAHTENYDTPYSSIKLPFDTTILTNAERLAQEKLRLNPKALVIIGIGGSNLGTIAVLEALHGKFYNDKLPIKLYFADTVDSDNTYDIAQQAENLLKEGNTVLINIISKSGSTTETIANAEFFLALLKKYHPDNYAHFVIVTTDNNSPLHTIALNKKFSCLTIPQKIGGRYSVFSAVGLFPLMLCNIDCASLLNGAQNGVTLSIASTTTNSAAVSAIIVHNLYTQGYTTHDTFLFSTALESIGKWYRQLLGESIGKEYDNNNQQVHVGITPTVSIGSTDLHSVGQLYLAGPHNIATTFVVLEQSTTTITVPTKSNLENIIPMISGVSFFDIMNAIFKGTAIAYQNGKRPFMTLTIPEKSEYYIGQLMQMKMIEVMYLAYLFNINPFDQPQVELYKKETKKILTK